MGIVALILGISTLVFSGLGCIPAMWWFSYLAIGSGIAGIVISAVGMKNPDKKGMKVTGLVLSIVGLVLASVMGIAWVACTSCKIQRGLAALGCAASRY